MLIYHVHTYRYILFILLKCHHLTNISRHVLLFLLNNTSVNIANALFLLNVLHSVEVSSLWLAVYWFQHFVPMNTVTYIFISKDIYCGFISKAQIPRNGFEPHIQFNFRECH